MKRLLLLCLLLWPSAGAVHPRGPGRGASPAFASAAAPAPFHVDAAAEEAASGVDEKTRGVILRFLASPPSVESPGGGGVGGSGAFRVQGWRWHSLSLARDARRLEGLADRLLSSGGDDFDAEGLAALESAASYVVEFNMGGLHRIEGTAFADFLREHLCRGGRVAPSEAKEAFERAIDELDRRRSNSADIGREVLKLAKAAANPSISQKERRRLLADVARTSRRLSGQLAIMRFVQERLVVPGISKVVPSSVQKSFNNRVLLNLGILESRIHLVGMRDAVWESGTVEEMEAFEREIPYVARAMIGRWRGSLYEPRAGGLDHGI
ncbi:hypothetical protein ACHAWF_011780 [Thalassiosira exigua]